MAFDQIKSSIAAKLASDEPSPIRIALQTTSAVTTISYRAGQRNWETKERRDAAGIVAAVTGPRGRRVVTWDDSGTLNADTVFEIGSVSKIFTSLLLSDMAERGEVALADPVAKYLPAEVKVPQRDGRQITLVDLATHTSSLPRLPPNLRAYDVANPYAAYSIAMLYEALSACELTRDIGAVFEYSNLGVGLLGHALALRAGMDYESLVRARITGPLGMVDTAVELSPQMKARLAVGYDRQLEAVDNWDLPTLAGAGALRSTANDLLTFVEANLGYAKTPLDSAMAAMLNVRRPSGMPEFETAMGWRVYGYGDEMIVGHGGHTGGYSASIGYQPKTRVGVAVLSNGALLNLDDIGLHLLRSKTIGSSIT